MRPNDGDFNTQELIGVVVRHSNTSFSTLAHINFSKVQNIQATVDQKLDRFLAVDSLWYPEVVPQMTGGVPPPVPVTENVSV